MIQKHVIAVILLAILTGCASHNVHLYGSVDSSDKSVTVQPGSDGMKGELKQALINDGWRLIIYQRGPSVTEGKFGEETKVETHDTFNSRYRLMLSWSQFDLCFPLTPMIAYDISFVDNHTGAEVFTLDGQDCQPKVVEKFMTVLRSSNK